MPKPIERFVKENQESNRRLEENFVQIEGARRFERFNFGTSNFLIPVAIEVYTRPLGNGLISGHPAAKHGSGRGVSGDVRGTFSLETDVEESEEFTEEGRRAIRDILAGDKTGEVAKTVVGSGTTDASVTDTSLESKHGENEVLTGQGSSTNITEVDSILRSTDFSGSSVSEYGVLADDGRFMDRVTTSSISVTNEQEILVRTILEVLGDGVGNSAVTDDGKEAVADSLQKVRSTIGMDRYVFGDGTSDPTSSDTSLDNQLFKKVCERVKDGQILTTHTVLLEGEPKSQPHTVSEIGIKDNNDRLIWRVVIDSFEKDGDVKFEAFASFRAK